MRGLWRGLPPRRAWSCCSTCCSAAAAAAAIVRGPQGASTGAAIRVCHATSLLHVIFSSRHSPSLASFAPFSACPLCCAHGRVPRARLPARAPRLRLRAALPRARTHSSRCAWRPRRGCLTRRTASQGSACLTAACLRRAPHPCAVGARMPTRAPPVRPRSPCACAALRCRRNSRPPRSRFPSRCVAPRRAGRGFSTVPRHAAPALSVLLCGVSALLEGAASQ